MQIKNLTPSNVFEYFDKILKIPRPSKKEHKIIEYLVNFAESNNLEYKKDSVGNIVIRKKASKGLEHLKSTILQSHVDMVCEKNSNIQHDFEKDPIPAFIDGDWIRSKGTTLGADNGIGVAYELAILADNTLKHGPLECLFTIDEETGLTGAFNLGENMFDSKILINLDSEDDGEVFIGCAGGVDTLIEVPVSFNKNTKYENYFRIVLTGLKGGHSGDDIEKGFANSIQLLTRFLWNASNKFNIALSDFKGGNLRNAIPREAEAVFAVSKDKVSILNTYVQDYLEEIKAEYCITEPNLDLQLIEYTKSGPVISLSSQQKLLCSLYSCPNGIMAMSQEVSGLVETSTNLASIRFNNDYVLIITSQRSSVESAKKDIADRIKSNFYLADAKVYHSDSYPGWTPNTNSEILRITEQAHEKLFGIKPVIRAIHAGLECGLFLEKYPDLDMVSIGPTIKGAHSPDERLQISTVKKCWEFVLEILSQIPAE